MKWPCRTLTSWQGLTYVRSIRHWQLTTSLRLFFWLLFSSCALRCKSRERDSHCISFKLNPISNRLRFPTAVILCIYLSLPFLYNICCWTNSFAFLKENWCRPPFSSLALTVLEFSTRIETSLPVAITCGHDDPCTSPEVPVVQWRSIPVAIAPLDHWPLFQPRVVDISIIVSAFRGHLGRISIPLWTLENIAPVKQTCKSTTVLLTRYGVFHLKDGC